MGRRPIYKSDEFFKSTSLVDQNHIYIRGKKATRRQARPKTHKRAGKRQTALKNPHDYSGSRSRAATRLRTSIVMAERKKDEQSNEQFYLTICYKLLYRGHSMG